MTKQQILEDAMKLQDAERLELAEALLESVAGPGGVPPEWQEEFTRRLAYARAHPEEALPLDDFLDWLQDRPLPDADRSEREAG